MNTTKKDRKRVDEFVMKAADNFAQQLEHVLGTMTLGYSLVKRGINVHFSGITLESFTNEMNKGGNKGGGCSMCIE